MSKWTQHLPNEKIQEIRQNMIDAGLVKDSILDLVLGDISPKYTGSLPGSGMAPNMKIYAQLQAMNKVHNLRNGDVPLRQWLTTAVTVAGELPVAELLDEALLSLTEDAAPQPAATLEAAAGGPMNTDIELEAMVGGADETVGIKFLRTGLEASRSVFKLLVHRHMDGEPEFVEGDTPRLVNGTGWMIGPGLLATNHHVVNARRRGFLPEADATEADFNLQADNIQILCDYHDKINPPQTVTTGPGTLVATDKTFDFAILRMPDNAPSRPPLALRKHRIKKRLDQPLGTRVNVLQHPNGEPMRIGFRDNFVTIGNETTLCYLTDTATGSSGSPVCDDGWHVAALHAGSQSVSDQNIVIRGRPIKRENFGTPIPTLLAKIQDHHPDLYEEIMGGQ